MRRAVCFWGQWGWISGIFFVLMAIAPSMVTEAQIQAQEQRSNAKSRELNAQAKQAERERAELIERSNERVRNGCQTLILNGEQVTIRAGMRGRDGVTGNPLQAGICVSDALGTTAVTDAEGYLVDVLPGAGMASGELKGVVPKEKSKEVDLNGYY
jgi:hypothetical protein